jgi:hypothetical protein
MAFFNKLGIQSKLISLVLLVSLVSIALTGLASYTSSQNSMLLAGNNQLAGLRNARAQATETLFSSLQEQVLTLGYQTMVIDAINQFKPAFEILEANQIDPTQRQKLQDYYTKTFIPKLKENMGGSPTPSTYFPENFAAQYLGYHYTVNNPFSTDRDQLNNPGDGSDYSRIHEKFHPRFRTVDEIFNYYDLFLVDLETGIVL